ncbi:MAG: P-II family nitrogen regulator [Clostridiales bacterium]|nr:P-II family nitrogen regulator [Clostridiales bacterium]MCD7880259.1 P-II family nitrogen regulator [Clostridiales bacterium]
MSELYMMVAIADRKLRRRFSDFFQEQRLDVVLTTGGKGTAVSEMLDYFGLESSEKTVFFSFVTGERWKLVRKGLQTRLNIDVPGTGVAFTVPMSSVGGKRTLLFLTANQEFVKGEESVLQDTKYELLVTVADQGNTDLIMDAARQAHAPGGTILHAKGTGMERASQFLGFSLGAEKELIFMVVKRTDRNPIMQAIMSQARQAHAIAFSLPVTSTAGMRLLEEDSEG